MTSTSSAAQAEQIRDVLVEVARTQVAAFTSAMKFWGGWVNSIDKYAQGIGDELAKISEGKVDSNEVMGRLADLSREYLRNVTELPNVAVKHFTDEIEKITKDQPKPQGKRRRAARAKG